MEAIKPGTCKEIMESGTRRDDDEDEGCYEEVNAYDYAINIQPPTPSKTTEKTEEEKNEYEEEDDEHLYDEPELYDAGETALPSSSPLPYSEPISSLSPERADSPLQYDHLPGDFTPENIAAQHDQEREAGGMREQQIDEPEEIYEAIYDDDILSVIPPPIPSTSQQDTASKASTLPGRQKEHTFHSGQKSASIPRNLSSLYELSLEDLSDLTQSEAQVWMLLQMQKMVQKMEDVYETAPAILSPKLSSKQRLPSPPHQEVQDEKDRSTSAPQPTQRGANYVNMDDLEKALSGDPPPPLPPKTYKTQGSDEFEKEKFSKSESTKETDKQRIKNVYSLQPQGKFKT